MIAAANKQLAPTIFEMISNANLSCSPTSTSCITASTYDNERMQIKHKHQLWGFESSEIQRIKAQVWLLSIQEE
jgi:hypothetical protein